MAREQGDASGLCLAVRPTPEFSIPSRPTTLPGLANASAWAPETRVLHLFQRAIYVSAKYSLFLP